MIGTTIEFFDFYIYATAAVLVFPKLFFAAGDPTAATLQSLATFALAFFARPVGSALFGHFGDRVGRKKTLVAALMTMGLSTVLIGMLPTYAVIGVWAPLLLSLCRFGQGLGLGGEWGGAVLLAVENAPPGRRARYGMFPQFGAPAGFLCSTSIFLLLSDRLSDAQFFAYGWRIPFLASAALIFVGLYVRLRLTETPAFERAIANNERVRVPMLTLWSRQPGTVLLGTLAATVTFVGFYLMTVFSLSWAIERYHYTRRGFLILQMIGVLFLALAIPTSGVMADRYGRYRTLIAATLGMMLYGLLSGGCLDRADYPRHAHFSLGRICAHGSDLRTAWDGADRALSNRGALYRRITEFQSGRHRRRLDGTLTLPCGWLLVTGWPRPATT